jgi:hypothetical protein
MRFEETIPMLELCLEDFYEPRKRWPKPTALFVGLTGLDEEIEGVLWRADLSNSYVHFERWQIEKRTPCGVWLTGGYGKRTWRSRHRLSKFAQKTKRLAVESLWCRSQCSRLHQEARLVRAIEKMLLAKSAWEQLAEDTE